MWSQAATVIIDVEGQFLDADAAALELLGVSSVAELRRLPPDAFAAVSSDPEEQQAWRDAYFASRAEAVLAEGPFRRLDGELVWVRTAILDDGSGRFRALFYPVERPTTNLSSRVFRIADVLAEWRSAERRLVDVEAGSPEAERLESDIALLRQQYQELFKRRS